MKQDLRNLKYDNDRPDFFVFWNFPLQALCVWIWEFLDWLMTFQTSFFFPRKNEGNCLRYNPRHSSSPLEESLNDFKPDVWTWNWLLIRTQVSFTIFSYYHGVIIIMEWLQSCHCLYSDNHALEITDFDVSGLNDRLWHTINFFYES